MSGTLYVVATPIGNLEDMTLRAVRVLKEADVIACEDTRQTRKLLDHFGISTSAISYHEHNEAARTADFCQRLAGGATIALVSDAGTPLISDPGFRLVREAVERGIPVVPIPGASAAIAALSVAGLPSDEFSFRGFPPRKPGERKRFFESLREEACSVILYEAPHRILLTLQDLVELAGDPPVVAGREITKLHEEFLRGNASEIKAALEAREVIRGEFTLVVGHAERPVSDESESITAGVERLEQTGLSRMDAIKSLARERGLSKREVYAAVEADRKA